MAEYVRKGGTIEFTATEAVAYHDVVPFQACIGVAEAPAAVGDTINVAIKGVFAIGATKADEIAQGSVVYYNTTTKLITKTDTGNVRAGIAMTAKAANVDGTVDVLLG